jgi:branched-chain amino acid aminotransferase
MFTSDGKLSEATGACAFLIRRGRVITPDLSSDILESITRAIQMVYFEVTYGRVADRPEWRTPVWQGG